MTSTTNHTCVFFDDGDLDLLCACGGRGVVVDDGEGTVVVALLEDASCVTVLRGRSFAEDLAVSA